MSYFTHNLTWRDLPEVKALIAKQGIKAYGKLMMHLEKMCDETGTQPDILHAIRETNT
jgi:hypothetical protein